MKATLVVLALVLSVFAQVALSEFAVTNDIVEQVNRANARWRARHNKFSQMPLEQVRQMLGLQVMDDGRADVGLLALMEENESNTPIRNNLPEAFDPRDKWPTCIHPIRDQAKCGSCWAFGASEVLEDRLCIASNGTVNVILSPQDMVSCDKLNLGCNGGILPIAWHYLKKHGVVSEACFPYESQEGKAPKCPSECADGSDFKANKYYAKKYYSVGSILKPKKREETIMTELITHGPVETGFTVYRDFMAYSGGIYEHVTGERLGGHAVKIIGYGVENGVKYWLVANSWGTTWGEEGFFRIIRGNNHCGFEGGAWAGLPDLSRVPSRK